MAKTGKAAFCGTEWYSMYKPFLVYGLIHDKNILCPYLLHLFTFRLRVAEARQVRSSPKLTFADDHTKSSLSITLLHSFRVFQPDDPQVALFLYSTLVLMFMKTT